jgi:hypothetical protein
MQKTLLALLSLLALASGARAQGCPITGISTTDVGVGTGVYAPSHLSLAWDASTCSLQVNTDAFTCCNVLVTQHFVLFGDQLLASPASLGRPFLPGSQLFVRGRVVFGGLPGTSSSFAVPSDPALIGRTFVVQAAPFFFTTVNGARDFGVTQAVVFSFQ